MDREGAPEPEGNPAQETGAADKPSRGPAGEGPAGREGPLPPEDLAAVAEEGLAVQAASAIPAAGSVAHGRQEGDRAFLYGALGLALLLVFGWLGGTAVWQLRRDLRTLEGRLAGAQAHVARVESLQARAALLRVRADLDTLRQTLPADMASEVARADAILGAVADRVASGP